MANIGFIGLGIMGKPMAGNLIKGGHKLFLNSRSGVAPELISAGGVSCSSAKEVAQKADIIITMVPDTPDVDRVLFGASGVAEGLTKGKTVVDMSSISPIETKNYAKRINAHLAAAAYPVLERLGELLPSRLRRDTEIVDAAGADAARD